MADFEATADQLKGKGKEALGNLTDDKGLENEGKFDQLAGEAREKVSEAGEAVKDKFNEVAAKIQDKREED